MGILTWIILGGLAGWLASMLTKNNEKMGLIKNIVVGILGAMIGGFVFSFFGATGVTGFNLWSIFVACVGAVIWLSSICLQDNSKVNDMFQLVGKAMSVIAFPTFLA
jgi:uncharacterized membrane protein YeaQ/YmgE (transglycosylase-associated protein family)